MDKLLTINIKTISRLLQEGTLTSTELAKLSVARAKKIKKFNAFITLTESEALSTAEESLDRFKQQKFKSRLDGIPVAIKDNFCTKGVRTTCASKMLENFTPTYDATVWERLKSSGAVLVGKTNLDQFAMGSGTVDSIFGPCRNIWGSTETSSAENEDFYIAGGSSGGSAVAVASGVCFAGIGSDTGGSTRNPASYCGVIGLKPTYGLVSRLGLIPLVNSMDVPGILTRTVDDCVEILNAVAGFDPKDSTSLSRPYRQIRLPPANKLSIKNLKIGIPQEYHCEHLSSEVLETWNEIAKILQDSGAVMKQISMPNTEHSIVCYSILNQCEVASNMARFDGIEYGFRLPHLSTYCDVIKIMDFVHCLAFPQLLVPGRTLIARAPENSSTEKLYALSRSLGFNEVVRNRILTGNYFLLTRNYDRYFNQALKVRRLIAQDFDTAWEQVQVLLTPTTLTTAPLYRDFVSKTNRDQCALQDYCTQPANMAGVPALSIPIKLSKKGMPVSLQLIGRNLSEPMLLALAKFIENAVQFPHYVKSDTFFKQ